MPVPASKGNVSRLILFSLNLGVFGFAAFQYCEDSERLPSKRVCASKSTPTSLHSRWLLRPQGLQCWMTGDGHNPLGPSAGTCQVLQGVGQDHSIPRSVRIKIDPLSRSAPFLPIHCL